MIAVGAILTWALHATPDRAPERKAHGRLCPQLDPTTSAQGAVLGETVPRRQHLHLPEALR